MRERSGQKESETEEEERGREHVGWGSPWHSHPTPSSSSWGTRRMQLLMPGFPQCVEGKEEENGPRLEKEGAETCFRCREAHHPLARRP